MTALPTSRESLIRRLQGVRLPTLQQVRAEQCRRSLAMFVRQAWPILNPGRPLEWGWYLDAICLHLEAVSRRDPRVKKLAVTQPPNTLKSTVASVCWPAWEWIDRPQTRWLCASNDGPLATRDALAMRDLVTSHWYREWFRPSWSLKDDQDVKSWFANTAGGHRISYSANAKVTGKKGDILLVDDANDAKKVHSPAERESVNLWYNQAFSGRVADETRSPQVLVGQRLDVDDLIGFQLRMGGWVELRLSEEYDPANRCVTPLWADPRSAAGEWLRPARFGPDQRAERVGVLTEQRYDAQHNQAPRESAGTWFDRAFVAGWLPHPPVGTEAVRYWDTAASTSEAACDTAGVLVGRLPDGRYAVLDVVTGKWNPTDRDAAIVATAHADRRRPGVRVRETWIEQEPGGSGLSDAESIIRKLAGFDARAWKETGDKDVRSRPLAAQWESRNVLVVEGEWNERFLRAMAGVPGAKKNRDIPDAAAGAFNRLCEVPADDGSGWGTAPAGQTENDRLRSAGVFD